MPHSGEKAGGGTPPLPDYLLQKENRVKQYRNSTFAAFEQEMDMMVKNTKGWSAQLRICQDTIEGSVLALGVSTSFELIKRIREVQEGIQHIQGKWAKIVSARREENRLYDELYEGSCSAFVTMRQKSEQLERELKTMIQERDRRDESLDNAIQYVHAVIAERAAWQEKFGYNSLELPMEELTFSERTTAALSALYYARRVQMSCDHPRPFSDTSLDNRTLQKVPIRHPAVSVVDEPKIIAKRWREIEDVRQSMASFSCRLKYIPPMEEVHLLRDTLAMGTGTSALMKDIENERKRLRKAQDEALKECASLQEALMEVKRELFVLKCFLREASERRAPFLNQVPEMVKTLYHHIEMEALTIARQWELEREQDREEEKRVGSILSPKRLGQDGGSSCRSKYSAMSGTSHNAQSFYVPAQPSMFSITDYGETCSRMNNGVMGEGNSNDSRRRNLGSLGLQRGDHPLNARFFSASSSIHSNSHDYSTTSNLQENVERVSEMGGRAGASFGIKEEKSNKEEKNATAEVDGRSVEETFASLQPMLSSSPKKLPHSNDENKVEG